MNLKNQDMFDYMFESLWEERKNDLIRAVDAKKGNERRPRLCKNILAYYKKKVEDENKEILPLTDDELAVLKDTWKNIWDLGVVDPEWYAIYKAKTGYFDPTFIGTDLHYYFTEWYKIDYDYLRAFLDKNYGDIILPCINHPETIIRKIHGYYRDKDFKLISQDEAVEKLFSIKDEGAVVKISRISSGGKGVTFISGEDTKQTIREKLIANRDVVVQTLIKQHKNMEIMNPSSVNSIRTICIMLNGESIPLSTVCRIGKEGSRVDNFSSGGFACGVNPDGTLKEYAYDSSGKRCSEHTNGFKWKDGKIPNFSHILDAIKQCHSYVPMFGVVSWDIAISENGEPVLIEYNVSQGQIDLHQYCNGPVYGEYREKIINEVFSNYSVKNGNMDYNFSIRKGECTITVGSKEASSVVIPAKIDNGLVRVISESAFVDNKKLEVLTINSRLRLIGMRAFYKCSSLRSVAFNETVTEFGRSCFNSCSSLESIILPEGTKTIRTMAFRNCRKLKMVYIPDSVETIEADVFAECPNITITCKKDSTAYNYAKENNINCYISEL